MSSLPDLLVQAHALGAELARELPCLRLDEKGLSCTHHIGAQEMGRRAGCDPCALRLSLAALLADLDQIGRIRGALPARTRTDIEAVTPRSCSLYAPGGG